VVEAALASRADIHARALANRLEAFKDGDRAGVVIARLFDHRYSSFKFAKIALEGG
jgi:hypothetical protein